MSIFKWTTPPKKIYTRLDIEMWPVNETFTYTWSDQTWTVPYTQEYIITCKWAGSNTSKWWLAQGTLTLNAGDVLSIMVGQNWWATGNGTYWFGGWLDIYSYKRSGGWLSWVFTGSWAITANDSARALVIWGWAWGWRSGSVGGAWGGETWEDWSNNWFWTRWSWWTQTWHWSQWEKSKSQFGGWKWYDYVWHWWGGWWRWGNWSTWDSVWDDDKWAGGWSGYVISTASNRVLTQWWWADANSNWEVTIVSVYQ